MFKTPEEAIAACDAECERAWQEYLTANKIDSTKVDDIVNQTAKNLFRQGYMAGARFISGLIVKKMVDHGQTHIIEPNES